MKKPTAELEELQSGSGKTDERDESERANKNRDP